MKKQILNIGKALNKAEQRAINGGSRPGCTDNVHIDDCDEGVIGVVFNPYFDMYGNPTGYGECCIFQN